LWIQDGIELTSQSFESAPPSQLAESLDSQRKKRLPFDNSCVAQLGRKAPYEGKSKSTALKTSSRKANTMLTNLISHERTPAHCDDSTTPFGPRRGGFISAADR
jgi:hypothetical protein